MNFLIFAAATIVAVASPAFAEPMPMATPHGHYEWRPPHQVGPRAPLEAAHRTWVSDNVRMAGCDCTIMKTGTADRMRSSARVPTAG